MKILIYKSYYLLKGARKKLKLFSFWDKLTISSYKVTCGKFSIFFNLSYAFIWYTPWYQSNCNYGLHSSVIRAYHAVYRQGVKLFTIPNSLHKPENLMHLLIASTKQKELTLIFIYFLFVTFLCFFFFKL